ncbi:hypothetical protein D3C73_824360 [compost metagenome]
MINVSLKGTDGLGADDAAMAVEQPVVRCFSNLLVELAQLYRIAVNMAVGKRKADLQIIRAGLLNLAEQRLNQFCVRVFLGVHNIQKHQDAVIIHIYGLYTVGLAANL